MKSSYQVAGVDPSPEPRCRAHVAGERSHLKVSIHTVEYLRLASKMKNAWSSLPVQTQQKVNSIMYFIAILVIYNGYLGPNAVSYSKIHTIDSIVLMRISQNRKYGMKHVQLRTQGLSTHKWTTQYAQNTRVRHCETYESRIIDCCSQRIYSDQSRWNGLTCRTILFQLHSPECEQKVAPSWNCRVDMKNSNRAGRSTPGRLSARDGDYCLTVNHRWLAEVLWRHHRNEIVRSRGNCHPSTPTARNRSGNSRYAYRLLSDQRKCCEHTHDNTTSKITCQRSKQTLHVHKCKYSIFAQEWLSS